ncbi:MAG: hypothetical protein D6705_03280 [Deltaproteobacteria bacterium]|nr:MAG: hypothetical protein D6705_03280 [Deltaproteobacteria bacterium]
MLCRHGDRPTRSTLDRGRAPRPPGRLRDDASDPAHAKRATHPGGAAMNDRGASPEPGGRPSSGQHGEQIRSAFGPRDTPFRAWSKSGEAPRFEPTFVHVDLGLVPLPSGRRRMAAALWAGAVYVFTRAGATWTEQAYVKASNTDAGDEFGTAVALSGDGETLAVGAVFEDSSTIDDPADGSAVNSGVVYLY